MTEQEIISRLTEAGGKLWEKGDKRRVYFDWGLVLSKVGLDIEYYNTGNISGAKFQGERISNSEAKRMIGAFRWVKLYYDLPQAKFFTSDKYGDLGGYDYLATEFCDQMRAILAN